MISLDNNYYRKRSKYVLKKTSIHSITNSASYLEVNFDLKIHSIIGNSLHMEIKFDLTTH